VALLTTKDNRILINKPRPSSADMPVGAESGHLWFTMAERVLEPNIVVLVQHFRKRNKVCFFITAQVQRTFAAKPA